MKKQYLLGMLIPAVVVLAEDDVTKKFAIHYRDMIGTETGDVTFTKSGTSDEWAPGKMYYPKKDLSRISYISRYFSCTDITFSQDDLVMKPGDVRQIDIAFVPDETVVCYVDKNVYSNNSNVAKVERTDPACLTVTAVSAGECTLRITHPEAGDRYIKVIVEQDEAYVDRKVDSLLALMTEDEKMSLLGGTNWFYTKAVDRLGIPQMRMDDGPNGVGNEVTTAYPPDVALAASWNRSLVQRMGRSLGRDCRARGIDILLGPAVNIYRSPLCGRNFEYMGEDPYLAGQTAASYIKGLQSQGVSATIKHFICNNSDYDRDHISNDMDERTMNEIYLPAFKAAVQEGNTGCLMTSYNLVNGTYTTHSYDLLTTILRDRWGFKGIVMSDWGSTHDGLAAAKGGLDLEMASGDHMTPDTLKLGIQQGVITMDDIDNKVRHILHTMISMGFWDGMQKDDNIPLDDSTSDSTALACAREGMVLLKNQDNLLPLDTSRFRHIVVTGKNAIGYVSGSGSGNASPMHYVSMYDGLRQLGDSLGYQVELKDKYDLLPAIMYTDDSLSGQGFKAEYFNNTDLSGTPEVTRTETKISHIWSASGPEVGDLTTKNYSVRWSAVMCSDVSASYTFTVGGDDGFRLIIDGTTVADGWTAAAYHTKSYTKSLVKGKKYNIVLEYYQKSGDARVDFMWKKRSDTKDHLAEYLASADLVVACFGQNSASEGEGHDRSFTFDSDDQEMLTSIQKSGKPAVFFINGGGAMDIKTWQDTADGIFWAFYGGQRAGTAAAEMLFGQTNPSGHLPMTFERVQSENPTYNYYHDPDGDKHVTYGEGIFVGYRGYDKLNREVQYPFGYGLSYTTFSLTDMQLSSQKEDGSIDITCTLTNTGDRYGAQVIQAYVGRQGGTVERPLKELKNYEKVFLTAGESRRVTINLPKSAFTYYSTDVHDFVYDAGSYSIMLGFSSRDIQCTQNIEMK